MRLFVAVELDEAAREALAIEQRRLRGLLGKEYEPRLRWVSPTQIHLTLAFLGEVADDRAAAIEDAMRRPLGGGRFEVVFGGLGVFPPRGAPRVLWLGLMRGAREVVALQRQVAERVMGLGIPLEDRAFHPHLTLARCRETRPADRQRLLGADRPAEVARIDVEAVTLIASRLSSRGADHTALCGCRLVEDARPPLQSP